MGFDHRELKDALLLVGELSTTDQIKEVLRRRKGEDGVRLTAETKEDLVRRNLREAVEAKAVGLDDVFELIRSGEENGNQHIFYYRPKVRRIAETLTIDTMRDKQLENWRDALKREGVLDRKRIVFIAHSTGGIVVRFLLLHNQDLFRGKMIGLALYASPSIGAPLANQLSFLTKFYGNRLGEQLLRENTFLTELNKDFRDLLYNPNSEPNSLRIVGAEGVENFFIVHRRFLPDDTKVVPEDSASHYFGAPVYLRGTDHFSTVKPDTVNHPGHQLLLTFYQKFKKDFGIANTMPTALPVFTTVYEDHNAAGQPYVDIQLFEKNDHYTQPPLAAGDHGHELAVRLAAPGPITNVVFRPDGVASGWTHETAIRINGTTAEWIGWSNSGDAAKLIFTISYKVARQICTANCQ